MDWIKVTVHTTNEASEIVSEAMMNLGAQGVEISGGVYPTHDQEECPWDYIDDNLVEKLNEAGFTISSYFPDDQDTKNMIAVLQNKLEEFRQMDLGVPLGSLEVSTEEINNSDFENEWKKYFKPTRVSDFITIKPTWEEYNPAEPDEIVIEMDPGMAFGTGTHETTKMCIKLLEEFLEEGGRVIDVGCGSGILSVVSAKLGAKSVLALDKDPISVEVTRENVQKNGCEQIVTAIQSDLLDKVEFDKADIVVANIIADMIIRLAPMVDKFLRHRGMFICSGIIDSRLDEVLSALEENEYRIINIQEMGEWRAVACKSKN